MYNIYEMIKELVKELRKTKQKVYIQTHDFPDPDAVASAFGLQTYLSMNNIQTKIVYCGVIQRYALKMMISSLEMKIYHESELSIDENDLIIIVDGCKWSKNVTDLPGFEIAIIDHHIVKEPDDVPYIDIRDTYGACSTIITGYYKDDSLKIPPAVATTLMIGIGRDTELLTRKVTANDIDAYHYLHPFADIIMVNSFLRNNIQLSDFEYFSRSIKNLNVFNALGWCYFEEGCETNLMGILGDFLLSAHEIEFTILLAKNNEQISISIRNENHKWDAAKVIKMITKDIGAGGGHKEMAGGVIFSTKDFKISPIIDKVLSYLND